MPTLPAMKLVGLIAPILLLLLAAFLIRQQYDSVVDRATSESNTPAFPIAATFPAFDSKLCGPDGRKCDFSNVLGTPSPRPGLMAPAR